MMPGKMNSREVKRMMAQMGIKSVDMTDVKKVVMEAAAKDYVIENPQVMMIEARGEKYLQISGSMKEIPKQAGAAPNVQYNEDDIKLIMDQAKVDRSSAIDALKKADGEVAQAIINLTTS
ncbi:nascent polypeptide-associated complex protein [mine drainage metagenome]|uniref:Nascent polypeptide-associated complex protein n=1 Tax=mine drainage metagenome TaxID=410659 RepID=T0ZN75_9ZZZZ